MKKAILVYRTKTICWVNIATATAIVGFCWGAINSVVFNGLISVLILWPIYDAFKHRNESIILTEKGIGLDKVCIFDGNTNKEEKCSHVDIEWRYVRRVELHFYYRSSSMDVYAHNKLYLVDTSYYYTFGRQIQAKRWRKSIEEYGQVPCSIK